MQVPRDGTELNARRVSIHPGVLPGLFLFGLALGVGEYRLGGHLSSGSDQAVAIEAYEKASHFVREDERIRVPPDSPLRAKLGVEPVREKEIRRSLVLPAAVEADPARLIKVLP